MKNKIQPLSLKALTENFSLTMLLLFVLLVASSCSKDNTKYTKIAYPLLENGIGLNKAT